MNATYNENKSAVFWVAVNKIISDVMRKSSTDTKMMSEMSFGKRL